MTKTATDIKLPEIDKKARLSFDVPAMEQLFDHYGDAYINNVLDGLDRNSIDTFKIALAAMLRDTDVEPTAVIEKMTLIDLAMCIADAISLKLHGKPFKQHMEENIAEAMKAQKAA